MPDGLPEVPAEMVDSIGATLEGEQPAAPAPDPSNQPTPETTATPEGQTTPEAATEAEAPDSFTKLDPNTLPPEARPFYDSMLSDYTRKTQEAAPWRHLGEELGVDSPDAIREAAELYVALQDPSNLAALYHQLAPMFEGGGQAPQLVPGQVPGQPATAAPLVPQGDESEFAALENPDVASLKQEIADMRDFLAQQQETQQQEAIQWQLLGELNRQEAAVQEAHPDWGEDEWNTLWNLSVAFDGDLHQAATYVEAAQNAAVTRLLNGKAAAAETPGLTPPAPNRTGVEVPTLEEDPELKGATAKAMEYLRGVVNLSE